MFTMLVIGGLAFSYSFTGSAGGIAAIAFAVEFMSTPAYPVHVQFVRGWVPAERHGEGFWLLGLSSRVGDILSKLSYSRVPFSDMCIAMCIDMRTRVWTSARHAHVSARALNTPLGDADERPLLAPTMGPRHAFRTYD